MSISLGAGLIALLLAGCASVGPHRSSDQTLPLPPEIAAYYEYPAVEHTVAKELLKETPRYTLYQVSFPFASPGFEPTEPTVEFEWYESKREGRPPTLILNPILGGDYPIEHHMCRYFASHGFNVAMPHRKTLKIGPDQPVERIELLLRQGIIRVRQVIDWVEKQERVDPERIGSFGISMGGIASVILAAVEPRLKTHVAVLPGGSIPDILMSSTDRMIRKPRHRYLKAHALEPADLEALLRQTIRTDPLLLAPYVNTEDLLVVIALTDRTIGTSNAFRLWRALGRPHARFLPTGHYTSILALPYLKCLSLRYFRKHL